MSALLQDEQAQLRKLYEQVREAGDRSKDEIFIQIAGFGSKSALEMLERCLDELRSRRALTQAYRAFGHFLGGEHEAAAIERLLNDSLHHRRDEHRQSACRGLAAFGVKGHAALERILAQSKDPAVRRSAIVPLIATLCARADAASLALLFECLEPQGEERGLLRAGLTPLRGEQVLAPLARSLASKSTSAQWRRFLLELLGEWMTPEANAAIAVCLEDELPELRALAIELLGSSADTRFAKPIEANLRSSEEIVVREAVVALAKLSHGDPKFLQDVLQLARSKSAAARMGAAVALCEIRTEEALRELYLLLRDAEWRVRSEALQQVASLRRKETIPLLIERLDAESLRLQGEIAQVLRLLTGLDLGAKSTRWREWWQAEGETFVLPEPAAALAREQARGGRAGEQRTSATFYGLRVVSDRVAFVLDHSGSMRERAGSEGRTTSEGNRGPTRLDVAKKELSKAIQSLADGVLFNIILFETNISPWMDELVLADEKSKAAALRSIDGWRFGRGTNVFDALETAFEDPRVDTIFLLSDGDPTAGSIIDPGEIRSGIERMNRTRKIVIHCIAVGKSSEFLRALATENGGEYTETF